MEDLVNKVFSVVFEDLNVTSCPAHSLRDRLLQGRRLLIVENCAPAEGDLASSADAVDRKFDIFCKKVERPSSDVFENFVREEETCSRDGG